MGVEYELMESFARYVRFRYGYDLRITWKNAGSFEEIYKQISRTDAAGMFGWSFFSITGERQREVNFTPAYMPDLNMLVTSNDLPLYRQDTDFLKDMKNLEGFTMAHTTMEEDIWKLGGRSGAVNCLKCL